MRGLRGDACDVVFSRETASILAHIMRVSIFLSLLGLTAALDATSPRAVVDSAAGRPVPPPPRTQLPPAAAPYACSSLDGPFCALVADSTPPPDYAVRLVRSAAALAASPGGGADAAGPALSPEDVAALASRLARIVRRATAAINAKDGGSGEAGEDDEDERDAEELERKAVSAAGGDAAAADDGDDEDAATREVVALLSRLVARAEGGAASATLRKHSYATAAAAAGGDDGDGDDELTLEIVQLDARGRIVPPEAVLEPAAPAVQPASPTALPPPQVPLLSHRSQMLMMQKARSEMHLLARCA